MDQITEVSVPRWAVILYGTIAVVLVPWIFGLAIDLPTHHLANNWDAVWVGFDIMMLMVIALTVYFALRRLVWVALSATALSIMFIIDAWFDIMTSRPGHEQVVSLAFGTGEIVLALITLRLVQHIVHHSTDEKQRIHLHTRR